MAAMIYGTVEYTIRHECSVTLTFDDHHDARANTTVEKTPNANARIFPRFFIHFASNQPMPTKPIASVERTIWNGNKLILPMKLIENHTNNAIVEIPAIMGVLYLLCPSQRLIIYSTKSHQNNARKKPKSIGVTNDNIP